MLSPGAAVASGGILASSPSFLGCIELELMICWAALYFRELFCWTVIHLQNVLPANSGGIGNIHFCLRSVSAWLGLAQRNPMCVYEGMNIKPSSLPFSCILTSPLSVSKDIFASAHRPSQEWFLEMNRLCCFYISFSFPCGILDLFKPEVPEGQNCGRRLLKHVQTGKENILHLTEKTKGFQCLRITPHFWKGFSANSEL